MRRINKDRGAVAVLVAVLMTALIGFAAIGVDISQMASDKQQLQNGADAGALAIAQGCAGGACGDTGSIAESMAIANRLDADSNATVTGEVVELNVNGGYVTVRALGQTNHWFAPIFGMEAATIDAQSTAVWQPLSGGTADLPLAFSLCEIVALAESTGVFTFEDGTYTYVGTEDDSAHLVTITLSKNTTTEGCFPEPSGNWLPGGFGWLDTTDGLCSAEIFADGSASSDTGVSPPGDCTAAYMNDLVGETVAIPIFDEALVEGTGTNAIYHILGWVGFHVTSLQFGGQYKEYVLPDTKVPCTGEERCIRGYFTELLEDGEGSDELSDLGARTVRLVLAPPQP